MMEEIEIIEAQGRGTLCGQQINIDHHAWHGRDPYQRELSRERAACNIAPITLISTSKR